MQAIKDWWPIIAFCLTLAGWATREIFISYNHLQKRVASQKQDHDAHEDICSRRYAEIASEAAAFRELVETRLDSLIEVNDERHQENLQRFADGRADNKALSQKIDIVLARMP